MKSSAGKVLAGERRRASGCCLSQPKITLDKRQPETTRLAMFKRAFCAIAHPTRYLCISLLDNSLFCLNSSTGKRSLMVTLQNYETRLSGIVGSKLHISGWFNKTI